MQKAASADSDSESGARATTSCSPLLHILSNRDIAGLLFKYLPARHFVLVGRVSTSFRAAQQACETEHRALQQLDGYVGGSFCKWPEHVLESFRSLLREHCRSIGGKNWLEAHNASPDIENHLLTQAFTIIEIGMFGFDDWDSWGEEPVEGHDSEGAAAAKKDPYEHTTVLEWYNYMMNHLLMNMHRFKLPPEFTTTRGAGPTAGTGATGSSNGFGAEEPNVTFGLALSRCQHMRHLKPIARKHAATRTPQDLLAAAELYLSSSWHTMKGCMWLNRQSNLGLSGLGDAPLIDDVPAALNTPFDEIIDANVAAADALTLPFKAVNIVMSQPTLPFIIVPGEEWPDDCCVDWPEGDWVTMVHGTGGDNGHLVTASDIINALRSSELAPLGKASLAREPYWQITFNCLFLKEPKSSPFLLPMGSDNPNLHPIFYQKGMSRLYDWWDNDYDLADKIMAGELIPSLRWSWKLNLPQNA